VASATDAPGLLLPARQLGLRANRKRQENIYSLKDNDDRLESIEGKANRGAENQLEESFWSCVRIKMIGGRFDSRCSYSSDQLSCSRSHSPPENPACGFSGRTLANTFFATLPSEDFPNGGSPVSTCRGEVIEFLGESWRSPLTSRIVIASAYISVDFEGSFGKLFFVNPNLSGSIISGALHRMESPISLILSSRSSPVGGFV
jgi:hypothetical protein